MFLVLSLCISRASASFAQLSLIKHCDAASAAFVRLPSDLCVCDGGKSKSKRAEEAKDERKKDCNECLLYGISCLVWNDILQMLFCVTFGNSKI